ncbi:hypothetical protein [Natronorubrum thiooxidans]|uniref:Uncharacterized protein n=1 Tax=Natronorubrum thiooxidans TaxID=308853 RepID=A0A1N7F022_9EURY|nr:hypothetical protein [Natronorubrum thiooxidans]SIR93592.1 hypothetical protein SAMN05421752_105213 [Natronorubrum thiooxidans]
MLRRLLIAFGIAEIAKPQPVIDACERIALENAEDAQIRPWALWGARLEGALFVWLLARRKSEWTPTCVLLAAAGVVLVFVPQPIINQSQRLVYANHDELQSKPWVKPAARLLGVVYLVVVALSKTGTEPDDSADAAGDGAA